MKASSKSDVGLDSGGAFRSALRNFQIEDVMVARDAHCSRGWAERRSMMLKEMSTITIDDENCNDTMCPYDQQDGEQSWLQSCGMRFGSQSSTQISYLVPVHIQL